VNGVPFHHLGSLISAHGYVVVATVVGLESMGLPLPGETTLVTAAVYAGTTHGLNIGLVVAAASLGAIAGDNIGFWIGQRFGRGLLERYGRYLRLDAGRLRLGQYLFARHGGSVVFFGRFVALLRAVTALLAGINNMPWRRFLFFNATGGIVWASVFGLGAYVAGEQFARLEGPLAVVGLVLAAVAFALTLRFVRHHEAALLARAEAHFRRFAPSTMAAELPRRDV
jgi:membrane protein DedA with SNARE-associated domain